MERSAGQKFAGAFIVGGLISVVAQCVMIVVDMFVPKANLVAPLMLVVLGVIGMVLVLSGAYKKIAEVGGFGAGVMFCGIVDAVANVFMGAAMAAGGKASAGFKASVKFAASTLGLLVLVGTILGLLFAGTPGVQAVIAGPTVPQPNTIMRFLYAFLMGGLISIEGQALLIYTKLSENAVILGNAALGMLLAIVGVSANLEHLAGAGLCAAVVDAGTTAVLGGAMIRSIGMPMVTISLVTVMVLVVCMGLICGNVFLKRAKQGQHQ